MLAICSGSKTAWDLVRFRVSVVIAAAGKGRKLGKSCLYLHKVEKAETRRKSGAQVAGYCCGA